MANPQYQWKEDFEAGVNGWNVTGPGSLSSDSSQFYEGGKSLRVTINNPGGASQVVVSKAVNLGAEAAVPTPLVIEHKAMVRPSAVPTGLSVSFDAFGTGTTGALVAGRWTYARGGEYANTSGVVNAVIRINVPAGASLSVWIDWIRFEVRFTPEETPVLDRLVFPFTPDWGSPVADIWEYPTAVFSSYDGHEQRSSLRSRPRRFLRFTAAELSGQESGRLAAMLWQNLAGRWYLPWWPGGRRTTQVTGAPATGASYFFATQGAEFVLGRQAVVWKDETTYDLMSVSSIFSDRVVLTGTNTFTHEAGCLVAPVKTGVAETNLSLVGPTSFSRVGEVLFEVETAGSVIPAFAILPTYLGKPLLAETPNEEEGLDETWDQRTVRLGGITGEFMVRPREAAPRASRPFRWFMDGGSALEGFRAVLGLLEGRRTAFWMPTNRQDLVLTADAAQGASQIVVQDIGYGTRFFPHKARKHLAIRFPDGTIHPCKVTAVADNGATETLTISPALPRALAATAAKCSFLVYSRLDADEISIEHHTLTAATSTVPMIEIPEEVPE